MTSKELENARAIGKDITNLSRILKRTIDEPIHYVSRYYGNKYIVPQELFEKQRNVLEIIKQKGVDVGYLKTCETLEEYNYALPHHGNFNNKLTEEEFNLLKEMQ